MRLGPGTRYRIDWVYKRRDLPVEIEREFDVWRWVRDADGIQGWVHQATLMGRRELHRAERRCDAAVRGQRYRLGDRDPQARRDRPYPLLRGCVRVVRRADRIISRLLRRRSSGACFRMRRSTPDRSQDRAGGFGRKRKVGN